MENQEYLADDFKKDKELFNSYVRALILPIIFLIFVAVVFYFTQVLCSCQTVFSIHNWGFYQVLFH